MPKTYASRIAGAVISAALTVGSLSLTATAAGACTGSAGCGGAPLPAVACPNPDWVKGVPPVPASAQECTDPKCLSGTQPAAVPWPGGRVTGRIGHGGRPARTADRVSMAASVASAHAGTSAASINCPPPNPSVAALISDC
jgi:hypothetical protein